MLASTAVLSLGAQNAAWATCLDGTTFPTGGFVEGSPALPIAANWSPNVFTGTTGSLFVPDTSVNEHNNTTRPLTSGGHNWVFDQGTTLCRENDTGPAAAVATAWAIPANNPADCVILPVIKGGRVVNLGDIPFQGEAITPTCDPSLLSTASLVNPANTYFNQLGCSISHGAKSDAQHATTFMFVAGIKGGLFNIALNNVSNQIVGGDAGKINGPQNYYADIPEGQKLTNAAVSPDGQFAMVTSIRRSQAVFACLNPLGDPGDPTKPIDPNFFVPDASAVPCMLVGNNNVAIDLATAFGPDNQPYFAGHGTAANTVTSFGVSDAKLGTFAPAWPQCITNGTNFSIAAAFAAKSGGHCGNAQPNVAFPAALLNEPSALIRHGSYMYLGNNKGPVMQAKVTVDPVTGLSKYKLRTYLSGSTLITGLGVAEDLRSLMVFSDLSGVGLAGQEVVTRLPVCEDM